MKQKQTINMKNRLITVKTSSYTLDLRVDYSNKEGRTMAESIITNALNAEIVPEIHIVPVEAAENDEDRASILAQAALGNEVAVKAVKNTIIPYDNSKEANALKAVAKRMGIKRLKWTTKIVNGVKIRTIDKRAFNGRGRNKVNTMVSKVLQSE